MAVSLPVPEAPDFRLFFLGQSISLLGTWMQMTAVAWLVWRLSHSAFLLGLVGFSARIPSEKRHHS